MFPFPLLSICQDGGEAESATSLYLAPPSETSYPVGEEVKLAFSTIPGGSTMVNPKIVVYSESVADGFEYSITSASSTYGEISITGIKEGTYKFYIRAINNVSKAIASNIVTAVIDGETTTLSLQ